MKPKYEEGQEVVIVKGTERHKGKIDDICPVKVRGQTVGHDFFVETQRGMVVPFYDDEGEHIAANGARLEPALPEPPPLREKLLSRLLDHLEREVQRHTGDWPDNTEDEAIDLVLSEMVECYSRAEDVRFRERLSDD